MSQKWHTRKRTSYKPIVLSKHCSTQPPSPSIPYSGRHSSQARVIDTSTNCEGNDHKLVARIGDYRLEMPSVKWLYGSKSGSR